MKRRCMIDIETLGLAHDSAIVQIAACDVDNTDITFNHYLDWETQLEQGRSHTEGTIAFWQKQPEEVYQRVIMNEEWESLKNVLYSFSIWCKKNQFDKYWVNGPIFDVGKLNDAYEFVNLTSPYKHFQIQDYKTAREWTNYLGIPHDIVDEVNSHDALDDCKFQSKKLIGWENKIKELIAK